MFREVCAFFGFLRVLSFLGFPGFFIFIRFRGFLSFLKSPENSKVKKSRKPINQENAGNSFFWV